MCVGCPADAAEEPSSVWDAGGASAKDAGGASAKVLPRGSIYQSVPDVFALAGTRRAVEDLVNAHGGHTQPQTAAAERNEMIAKTDQDGAPSWLPLSSHSGCGCCECWAS